MFIVFKFADDHAIPPLRLIEKQVPRIDSKALGKQEVHEHEASGSPGTRTAGGVNSSHATNGQGQDKRLAPPLTICTLTAEG